METMELYFGCTLENWRGQKEWFWSLEEVWNDFTKSYSYPVEVVIPEGFHIGKTIMGETMFFKDGRGYDLSIENQKSKMPVLVGDSSRHVKVEVIGDLKKLIEEHF